MNLLLIVSIVVAVVKSSVYNRFAKKANPDLNGIFGFNMVSYGIAALAALLSGLGTDVSLATIVCALFYGVIVCSLQGLSVYAMKIGPMSTTSLVVLYGMVIPMIAGPIFWKEPLSVLQLVGTVMIIVSIWLINKKEADSRPAEKKWIWIIIILFFLSGFAGLMEKIHQSTSGRDEKSMFLFSAYLIMFVISLFGKLLTRKNGTKGNQKTTALYGSISGIIIFGYALVNLTLAGNLDSMIYYPVSNGGAFILTVLVSVAVFGEKCTKKQVFGFVTGLLSVLLLSLPV